MSSFLGHSLAAAGILAGRKGARDDLSRFGLLWFGCLLLATIAPDLDYFVPALAKSRHGGIRISHSMGFAFIVPAVVCMGLVICGVRNSALRLRMAQVVIAGQSHIFLDFLVGVHPMPIFWPLVDATFRSPFGLLPSGEPPVHKHLSLPKSGLGTRNLSTRDRAHCAFRTWSPTQQEAACAGQRIRNSCPSMRGCCVLVV